MKKNEYIIIDPIIQEYCDEHTTPEPEVLLKLNRETHVKIMHPRMLSGHHLGATLKMLSRMIKPRKVLEIGTYTGYSAICLAEGLIEGGELHTIEVNVELEEMIRKYLKEAEISNKVNLHIGDALEILPELDNDFDLVLIDADKENYINYYNLAIEKINKGGFILIDNTLWDGKVLNPSDEETRIIAALNDLIQTDQQVENVLLPVRDGLMLIRKK